MPLPEPKHGTNSRYASRKWKCRCKPCTDAHRVAQARFAAGIRSTPEERRSRRQAQNAAWLEDVTFLLDTGQTHVDGIVRRVGFSSPDALKAFLYMMEKPSLVARVNWGGDQNAPRPSEIDERAYLPVRRAS